MNEPTPLPELVQAWRATTRVSQETIVKEVAEQTKEVASTMIERAFVRETLAKMMVKMEAIIIATMEAIKSKTLPTSDSKE